MSICSLGSQGGGREERFSGSVIAGNKKGDPNERRGVRIVAKGRRRGGKKFFARTVSRCPILGRGNVYCSNETSIFIHW